MFNQPTFCHVTDLGVIPFDRAYQIQKFTVQKVLADNLAYVYFCEHPLTITIGRMGTEQHILAPASVLHKNQVAVHQTDRGGDVTLHALGQLVVYPIFNLNQWQKDLHRYLKTLEEVIINLLQQYTIAAETRPGLTGVWVRDRKIASIGIGVRRWVTYHGFSLNVNIPLHHYDLIKPCGLDVAMTSMAEIKRRDIEIHLLKQNIIKQLAESFHWQVYEQTQANVTSGLSAYAENHGLAHG